jgi:hypothetical protein
MRLSAVVGLILLVSSHAWAAEGPADGVSAAFEAGTGALGAIKDAGGKPSGYAVAERLPDGGWLVEATYEVSGQSIRLPIKFDSNFETKWVPVLLYGDALLAIIKSGALPKVEGSSWGQKARLPAFPVIVTGKRIITVFGELPFEASPKVEPIDQLMKHTARWIDEVLANDPGPASFDILGQGNLAWVDMIRVVYSVSMAGLFELAFVGPGKTGLESLSGLSPVVYGPLSESSSLVTLGISSENDGLGFRVSIAGVIEAPGPKSCAPAITFCASTREEFQAGLGDVPAAKGARTVIAPEFNVPFQTLVEITSWPDDVPVLSVVAP